MHESGAQNPDSIYCQRQAIRMYEQIRNRRTDYINVARNTRFSVEQCKIVKDYLFINRHELTGGYKTFYPDFAIASSWMRLSEKNGKRIERHDAILLYHELYEIQLMLSYSEMSQSRAHKIAENKYNYSNEAERYYKGFGGNSE